MTDALSRILGYVPTVAPEQRLPFLQPKPSWFQRAQPWFSTIGDVLLRTAAGMGNPAAVDVLRGMQQQALEEQQLHAQQYEAEQRRRAEQLRNLLEWMRFYREGDRFNAEQRQREWERFKDSIQQKLDLAAKHGIDVPFSEKERELLPGLPEVLKGNTLHGTVSYKWEDPDTGEVKLIYVKPDTNTPVATYTLSPKSPITKQLRELAPLLEQARINALKRSGVGSGGGGGAAAYGDISAMDEFWQRLGQRASSLTDKEAEYRRAWLANKIDPLLTHYMYAEPNSPAQQAVANTVHGYLNDILTSYNDLYRAGMGDLAENVLNTTISTMHAWLGSAGHKEKVKALKHAGDPNRPLAFDDPQAVEATLNILRMLNNTYRKALEVHLRTYAPSIKQRTKSGRR